MTIKDYITSIVAGTFVAICVCLVIDCGILAVKGLYEDIYYAKAQIVEVNDNVYTAMTADGNL